MHSSSLSPAWSGVSSFLSRPEQPRGLRAVALVLHQRPRPVQRRRAEIFRVPGDDIAGAVAHRTADAFDAGVDRLAGLGIRTHPGEIVLSRAAALEATPGTSPLVEEAAHVRDEI